MCVCVLFLFLFAFNVDLQIAVDHNKQHALFTFPRWHSPALIPSLCLSLSFPLCPHPALHIQLAPVCGTAAQGANTAVYLRCDLLYLLLIYAPKKSPRVSLQMPLGTATVMCVPVCMCVRVIKTRANIVNESEQTCRYNYK